jgi:hypothetical protein
MGAGAIFLIPGRFVIIVIASTSEKAIVLASTFFVILGFFLLIMAVATIANPYREEAVSTIVESPHLDLLDQKMGILLAGYRDSLKFVDLLPVVGLIRASMEPMNSSEASSKWLRPFWGGGMPGETTFRQGHQVTKPVVRPFVRLHVETHIRRQLLAITRRLRYEGLTLQESDPRLKRFDFIQSRLGESVEALFGWSGMRRVLIKIPLLPILGAGTIFFASLRGLEEPSTEALRKSLLQQVNTHSWGALLHQAIGIALIVCATFYVLYLLIVPIVAQGFNAKKALFARGGLSSPENNPLGRELYRVVWKNFPPCNIYRAEDEVFDVLGVEKRPELQADVIFAALSFLVCSSAAAAEALVLRGSFPWYVDVLLQIGPLFFVLMMLEERRICQRRRLEGHV